MARWSELSLPVTKSMNEHLASSQEHLFLPKLMFHEISCRLQKQEVSCAVCGKYLFTSQNRFVSPVPGLQYSLWSCCEPVLNRLTWKWDSVISILLSRTGDSAKVLLKILSLMYFRFKMVDILPHCMVVVTNHSNSLGWDSWGCSIWRREGSGETL